MAEVGPPPVSIASAAPAASAAARRREETPRRRLAARLIVSRGRALLCSCAGSCVGLFIGCHRVRRGDHEASSLFHRHRSRTTPNGSHRCHSRSRSRARASSVRDRARAPSVCDIARTSLVREPSPHSLSDSHGGRRGRGVGWDSCVVVGCARGLGPAARGGRAATTTRDAGRRACAGGGAGGGVARGRGGGLGVVVGGACWKVAPDFDAFVRLFLATTALDAAVTPRGAQRRSAQLRARGGCAVHGH